jgi:hypothetical protein
MPGIVQTLELLIDQASIGKTVAEAQKAGTQIGNAIGNAPGVKDAARKLGEELAKASGAISPMTTAMAQANSGSAKFAEGLRRASQQNAAVGDSAEKAGHGLGKVQNALFNVASQATGTTGPVSKLVEGLLSFGGGGTVVLAVAAGLAIIAKGYELITAKSREATKALNEAIDAAKKANFAALPEQIQRTSDVVTVQKQLNEALARFAQGQRDLAAVSGGNTKGFLTPGMKVDLENIKALSEQVNRLKREIAGVNVPSGGLDSGTAHAFDPMFKADDEARQKREEAQRKAIEYAKELAAQLDAVTEAGRRLEGQAHLTAVEWGDKAFKELNDKAENEEKDLEDLQKAWDRYQLSAREAIDSLLTPEEIHLEYLDKQRAAFLDITDAAQGLIEVTNRIGALGDAAAQTFTDLNNVAVSLKEISLTGASFTNVANLVQTGIGLIGDVVHAIHRNKDPGRLRTNEQMFERAMNGDTEALEFLRAHSVVSHNGSVGWGSQEAATDAHAKYMEAKAVQDAQAQPAKDAANAQHDAEIAAMQKQAGLDQQRLNEQAQVSQHEAQAAMDHRAKVFKDANRLGLGQAAANTGVLFNAAAIAGQGALGHDSPLYVEAEKKAEDALRDLERQVEQAQKQVDDAKQTKADQAGGIMAGFTVQRSITQASGDRLVGELTTQTVYLKQIRDAVAPQGGGAAAGILAALPPIHVSTTLNVDGEKMAKNVSHHQSKRLQHQQAMSGNSGMPA